MRSETIGAVAAALSAAQASMSNATKSGTNPHLKSTYSDLADVWDACRAVLGANKLSIAQPTIITDGGGVAVETILLHESGEWISGLMPIISEKSTPQAMGSALTYARRQALGAMVGISPSDDDGEAAMLRDAGAPARASSAARALANGQRAAMAAPPVVLGNASGEGPYRVHSVKPGEGNRPTMIKLVDAGGAIRDTVTWRDETTQAAEGLFDDGGWVTVAVTEKQGREKRDSPGERWPSSFELDGIKRVESPAPPASSPPAEGAPLGSPVLAAGEAAAGPAADVNPDDLPF